MTSYQSDRATWVYNIAQEWLKTERFADLTVSCGGGGGEPRVFHCHKIMVRPFLQHNCGLANYEDVEVVMIPEVREDQFRQYLNYVYGLQQEQEQHFTGTLEEILSLGYSAIKVKLEEEEEEDCDPECRDEEFRLTADSSDSKERKSVRCEQCQKIYTTEGKLKLHFVKSHPELDYISPRKRLKADTRCSLCGAEFKRRDKLRAHMRSRHTLVSCSCGSTFPSEYKYYEHKQAASNPTDHSLLRETLEPAPEEVVTISVKKVEKDARTWPCLQCSQVFSLQKLAKEHMLEVHWAELKEKGMLYSKHGSVIITTICCDYDNCNKYFRDKADKLEHMSSVHRKERNHICHICSKTFSGRKGLKIHLDMKHSQVNEEIMCTDCGEVFENNAKLKYHQNKVHKEKVLKYCCRFCDYKTYSKPQLKEHERTHTGEKPEICAWCGQGFSSKRTLVNHERLHTGEKPYQCKLCSSSFAQRTSLNVHVKTHHKLQAAVGSKVKNYKFSRSGSDEREKNSTCNTESQGQMDTTSNSRLTGGFPPSGDLRPPNH